MQPLTARLLKSFPYPRHAGPDIIQRGRGYYRAGRVHDIELPNAHTAVCQVDGNSGEYEVKIQAVTSREALKFSCDCPYADGGLFCKHMVAAGLELADYLDEFGEDDDQEPEVSYMPPLPPPPAPPPQPPSPATRKWQNQLGQVLGVTPPRRYTTHATPYVGLVILERADPYIYGYVGGPAGADPYTLTPFVFAAADWAALTPGAPAPSPAALLALLAADRKWLRVGQPLTRALDPAACLNLSLEAVGYLNALHSLRSNYYGQALSSTLPMLLTMLAKLEVPLFLGSTRTPKIDRPLRALVDPVDILLDLNHAPDMLTVRPGLDHNGEFLPLTPPVTVVSRSPTWAVLGEIVAPLRDPQAPQWLGAFPIQVPAADVDAFREQYFPGLAQRLPFRSGAVQWRDVQVDPLPRLYLRDDRVHGLTAQLRFAYGDHELPAAQRATPTAIAAISGAWELARIHRQPEREDALLDSLAGKDFGLKRIGPSAPFGTLALRARVHPFEFLLNGIPRLTAAGFEIYGEETLKIGKINRSTPTMRVTVASGIDWFDLQAVVEFGDQQVALQEVRKALQRGERFIKLADGSAGQIPADWLEKTKHLWDLATETPEGFRVSTAHLPLLDPLLEADPSLKIPRDLAARRKHLRSFEHIPEQPVPTGFTGELRAYQRHGVDWLCFLHDYKFGGILADDMGLGKTVQVLAFLQLLKERAGRRKPPASLLVVPKSLIANWQREAARFTPGLRLLPYVGGLRPKDAAAFAGHDIILTTYGTMLRDVDSLRRYQFNYVILDESQAIKNPLAKSARAARLLQAAHRLVLTGTPVENNTSELWSQFAFLNPGLLGQMDYFRSAFALPIESRGDEAAAATLRSLVYPFILRRTKAQVAPELPPRTERIMYADMEAAQQKLYARTRARYQAELLNLIDTQGLNDTRFKILEGLLRLRQIAIHPALVEPTYRGGAPKLELLLETLETLQAENHKALIFSQFVAMLKLVRHELDARQIKYVYLDGRTTDRQARVDQFQTDPAYPFFLISLKAGGVGLNLTAADYVIHLDPWWNPAVEMQASDRAHRIGQDKPVFIYKLIARDTVEEKILQLQEKKRALVESLVASETGFFKSLTRDDVKSLFD